MGWKEIFTEITTIPRASGHEDAICRYLCGFAEKNRYRWETDPAGNLIIDIPATAGYENRKGLILQGHMDMVCVKTEDSPIDFNTDAIPLRDDGEWLFADGTSLGADNGIALAYAMALCEEKTAPHPPLRFLLTRGEEEGLSGASALSSSVMIYDRLINLDSEEDRVLYIGCAGGVTFCGRRQTLPIEGHRAAFYKIVLSGLPGGHSGSDIGKNRPNAIVELAGVLSAMAKTSPLLLCSFTGGEKHNVIPSRAEAVINTDLTKTQMETLLYQVAGSGISGKLTVSGIENREDCFPEKETKTFLSLLTNLPNGALAMSSLFEKTVETSANPAIVRCLPSGDITIVISARSLTETELEQIRKSIAGIFSQHLYFYEETDRYPMWSPVSGSPLQETVRKAFLKITGTEPRTEVIHAGLECGIFASLKPDLDMVSFGPQMENVHSVKERLNIASADRIYEVLKAVIAAC